MRAVGGRGHLVLGRSIEITGVGPSELRRMRQLEEENAKLKRLAADLSLDKAMLQDVLQGE
ncbi:hypothetical protein PSUB009319_12420 [Ralstonia sp. SET104]|nr:hypothetical protein PSUB009319_12420 [Ralstonia sp. SET104]